LNLKKQTNDPKKTEQTALIILLKHYKALRLAPHHFIDPKQKASKFIENEQDNT
jgi:hypothetical protein